MLNIELQFFGGRGSGGGKRTGGGGGGTASNKLSNMKDSDLVSMKNTAMNQVLGGDFSKASTVDAASKEIKTRSAEISKEISSLNKSFESIKIPTKKQSEDYQRKMKGLVSRFNYLNS